jgi:hypothetical protein
MSLALGLKGDQINLKTKLSVKRLDGLLLAVFYFVVGVAQLVILALLNFAPFIFGILAVLSFMAAYGLFTVKKWSVWLVIGLFFPQLVFGIVTLYAAFLQYTAFQDITLLLLNIVLVIFIVLIFTSFVYVAAKRRSFQQA